MEFIMQFYKTDTQTIAPGKKNFYFIFFSGDEHEILGKLSCK